MSGVEETKKVVEPLKLEHPTRRRRRQDKTLDFVDAPFPEEVDPHIYYDVRDRLKKLGKIVVKWNARKTTGNNAISQVWELFPNLMEKMWAKRKEILEG